MSLMTIAYLLPFAAIVGLGIGVGIKCVRVHAAARSAMDGADQAVNRFAKDDRNLRLLPHPAGRKRES
jgi:hypothetical protein